jgi:hypothetical protein
MPNHFKYLLDLRFWLAFVMLAGCVGAPLTIETPAWYLQESGAYLTANGRVFHGIGQAQGSSSAILLRATAANRARKQMARVLDLYVSKLFQSAGTMPALTMEQGEQVIGALVRSAVRQSVISETQSDPGKAQHHALCKLDLEIFKQVLASQTRIDNKARIAMLAEADRVHALLVGEQTP